MIVVGLTGSIAAGKSTAAQIFSTCGIPVFDSDAEVHRLYSKGGEGVSAIADLFPEAVNGGAVDRNALSKIVLDNPEALNAIEAAIHPLVQRRQEEFLARCRKQNADIALLDIPLLFEAGYDRKVDRIIVVSAPAEILRRRALERPGMRPEKLEKILSRQMPDEEKRKRSHYIVDTSGALENTREQIEKIIAKLRFKGEKSAQ